MSLLLPLVAIVIPLVIIRIIRKWRKVDKKEIAQKDISGMLGFILALLSFLVPPLLFLVNGNFY